METEAKEEVKMMPLVQLPSGVCLRLDKIVWISRHEINKFVVIMDTRLAQNPVIDGKDLDVLIQIGVVQKGPEVPALATA